jgi:predicted permease
VHPSIPVEIPMRQEFAHALRSLRRSPGFSLLAIATITLGVAANTAIFSMVEGVLLRRLPYTSGERLIHVRQASAQAPDVRFSIPEIQDIRSQTRRLDAVVEYHSMAFQLYGLGDPQRLQTGVVSDNFFQAFGVQPFLGRLFRPGEESVDAAPVVLLSYSYWANTLGADPKVIGAQFTMNDRIHTVVGVLPPLPTYPGNNDIWVPAGACPFRSAPSTMASRTARLPTVFARLKPGVSVAEASSEMQTISQRLHATYAEAYPSDQALHWTERSVRDELTADSKSLLLVLFTTAVFLMVVAAANFAGITVARQLRRGREFAMREALGAGRMRLFRQLAIESVMLSAVGGLLGTLLAWSGLGILRSFATRVTPRAGEIHVDAAVLSFAVLTCLVVGLVAAAAPFLRSASGTTLIDRLRQGNSSAMAGRADVRVRRLFVFAQVAIAFVLLVGAGLVGRSLIRLERVDAGFDGHNVMSARVTLNFSKYTTRQAVRAFTEQLLARLDGTPGMTANAIASNFPLNNAVSSSQAFIIGGIETKPGPGAPRGDFTSVSPRYFDVVGVPIKRGRTFLPTEGDSASVPVVISQRLATTYWKNRDPIGTRISIDSGRTWNFVVGVAGDVHQNGLNQDIVDEVYYPASVFPPGDMRILVHFDGSTAPVAANLRRIVHEIDPQQAIVELRTLDQVRGNRLSEPRLTTALLATFATVALILAASGLAGVIGYSVSQRIPEIAIRMALGADHGSIIGLVGRDGLSMVVVGMLVGAGASVALGRFVKSLLFGVEPTDALTYGGVSLVLVATVVIACLGPARRALAANPADAIRGGGG